MDRLTALGIVAIFSGFSSYHNTLFHWKQVGAAVKGQSWEICLVLKGYFVVHFNQSDYSLSFSFIQKVYFNLNCHISIWIVNTVWIPEPSWIKSCHCEEVCYLGLPTESERYSQGLLSLVLWFLDHHRFSKYEHYEKNSYVYLFLLNQAPNYYLIHENDFWAELSEHMTF